jgi:hypothetical protein
MIGLGSMMKLARGGLGPDELGEILAAAGMDLKFTPVPAAPESFISLGEAACLPGAKLVEIKGSAKGGDSIHCLMIMNQSGNIA